MGRRVKTGEDRRKPINSRIRDELRTRLEDAAKISGRTLSHEIEERLERSFDEQDQTIRTFHNIENLAMATTIANAWNFIEVTHGKSWMSSPETISLAREVTDLLLSIFTKNCKSEPLLNNEKSGEWKFNFASKAVTYMALCLSQGIDPTSNVRDKSQNENEQILKILNEYY